MSADAVREYESLYEAAGGSRLYTAPWWLGLTCGPAGWTALCHRDPQAGTRLAMPIHTCFIRGMKALVTPPLTQWVDVLAESPVASPWTEAFIAGIPRLPIMDVQVNGMPEGPFAVHRIRAALRYSYILPATPDIAAVRASYSEGLRRNLREARSAYTLDPTDDSRILLSMLRASYAQQEMSPPPGTDDLVPRVMAALLSRGQGRCLVARDGNDVLAAVLVAWDPVSTYYLAGGRTARPGGASAHAILLDHAVEEAMGRGTTFDFEGSMHPGIANFFQSFGARPEPFTRLTRFTGPGRLWALLRKR
jgi:hypothetical protein